MEFEKGPWRIEHRSGGLVRIGTDRCPAFMSLGGRGAEHAFGNGIRIVAALNACEGLLTTELFRIAKGWKGNVAEAVMQAPTLSIGDTVAAVRQIDELAKDAGVPEPSLGHFWEWLSNVKFLQKGGTFTAQIVEEILASIPSLVGEFLKMFRSDVKQAMEQVQA